MYFSSFGAPISDLQSLIEAKTVTLPGLMTIAPAGTIDPTAMIYDSSMYTMSAVLAGAFLSNALVKPVDKKFMRTD